MLVPGRLWAVEAVPALTDREIAERLTRLEEGQGGLREAVHQLRADMNRQNEQLRADMRQLRLDLDRQFTRQAQLTLAVLAAFTALVAAIIGFALWDRRTMIRPFERAVRSLEEDIGGNRRRLEALLDALRVLGQRDPAVAGVLRDFHLL